MEYHSIKWHDDGRVTRLTREVNIQVHFIKDQVFEKDGEFISGVGIQIQGNGDNEHHLVEDTLILLKKIAEVKCGAGH